MLFESEASLKKEIEDINREKSKQAQDLHHSIKELQGKNKDLNEANELDKKKMMKLKRLLEEAQHELVVTSNSAENEKRLLQDQVE